LSGPLFVFAGGGTGGHLFPGIAVAGSLKQLHPDAEFLFAGSGRTVEQSILADTGFEAFPLNVPSMASARRHPLRFLRGHFADWMTARQMMREKKPAAVIGLGGLASFAVSDAAGRAQVPVILLEQNVIPGRATRRLAHSFPLCTSFPETTDHLRCAKKIVCTGNPLRPEIVRREPTPEDIARRITLLILGGSQGSKTVNDAVLQAAQAILESDPQSPLCSWNVIHQTGPDEDDRAAAVWKHLKIEANVKPFFSDLPSLYSEAGLVISRSGATTLAELACLNLPSILLPYKHARDDHQTANARSFESAGAAKLIDTREPDLEKRLAEALGELIEEGSQRESMSKNCESLARPDAADRVARFVCELAGLTAQS